MAAWMFLQQNCTTSNCASQLRDPARKQPQKRDRRLEGVVAFLPRVVCRFNIRSGFWMTFQPGCAG
jgi:hypothetical protein